MFSHSTTTRKPHSVLLGEEALHMLARAAHMCYGVERDLVLKRAGELKSKAYLLGWAYSIGLKAPL